MRTTGKAILVVCLALLSAAGAARAQSDRDVKLGKVYRDAMHGFSLRPPADTERRREFSATRLVSWVQRDAQTGAVAATFTVFRDLQAKEAVDLKAFSAEIAKRLKVEQNLDVDAASVHLLPVAGKGAVQLEGITGGAVRLWERQVWVLVEPKRFLIFSMRGPETAKTRLGQLSDAILETLTLFDPKAEREMQEKNLARGQDLLGEIDDKALRAAVRAAPQWFLLRWEGKPVGFMKQTEGPGKERDASGWQVTSWVMLQMPKDDIRLMKRVMFVTADRSMERWKEQLQVGEGEKALSRAEDGLKQKDLIVCNAEQEGRLSTHQQNVPGPYYLPRATGMLLPRLVDLSKPAAYSFATYDGGSNRFDIRTFTVVGKDRLTVDGKRLDAIKASDRPNDDAEASILWLDEKGNLLRMQSPEGLLMEPSDETQVRKAFPRAEAILSGMARWASQN